MRNGYALHLKQIKVILSWFSQNRKKDKKERTLPCVIKLAKVELLLPGFLKITFNTNGVLM